MGIESVRLHVKKVNAKNITTSHKQYLAQKIKPIVLQDGVLYRFGQDNMFHHVLQP
jgi:hypothetical protein